MENLQNLRSIIDYLSGIVLGYLFGISALKGNYLHSRELAYDLNNYRHYLFDRRITGGAKYQQSICPEYVRVFCSDLSSQW